MSVNLPFLFKYEEKIQIVQNKRQHVLFFFGIYFLFKKKIYIFLDINEYNFSLFLFFSRDGDPVQLLFVKLGVKKKKNRLKDLRFTA